MYHLIRLGPKASSITRLIAERVKEAGVPYVVTGASALIVRGVIDRETKDVDVNIMPRKSIEVQDAIRPHLDNAKEEGLLVDGRTPEIKAAQTKFRVYKRHEATSSNIKVDISENECVLNQNAYTEIEGVRVATVPLMVIFKICAISRHTRSTDKLALDIDDLEAALRYLIAQRSTVPEDIQLLLKRENPPFVWQNFWGAVAREYADTTVLESGLQAVGIKASFSVLNLAVVVLTNNSDQRLGSLKRPLKFSCSQCDRFANNLSTEWIFSLPVLYTYVLK
ncbi:hypothetical protein EIP86_005413 [Pleurotus ostreatoroseus]|nr:hypothetical protein EIP86_005413 [Pleurotus ostreatoroseus]